MVNIIRVGWETRGFLMGLISWGSQILVICVGSDAMTPLRFDEGVSWIPSSVRILDPLRTQIQKGCLVFLCFPGGSMLVVARVDGSMIYFEPFG